MGTDAGPGRRPDLDRLSTSARASWRATSCRCREIFQWRKLGLVAAGGIAGRARRDARRAHLAAAHSPEPGRRAGAVLRWCTRWRRASSCARNTATWCAPSRGGGTPHEHAAPRSSSFRTTMRPAPRWVPSASASSRANSPGSVTTCTSSRTRSRDSASTGRPTRRCRSAARCIAAPSRSKLPLAGKGLLQRAVNFVLRRLLAPVGWEYFWAAAATRKALRNRAHAAARHRDRHLAAARARIAGRRDSRAATALAADPRLSRPVERV